MVGFLAGDDLSPNPIELARRTAPSYIDLTSSNPTEHGLLFPLEILQDAAADYWETRRYTPDSRGQAAARDAICQYYAARAEPLAPTRDDIFVTASTSEAYSLLFALLAEPGDNVLAPAVSYPLFDYLAAIHNVELRPYALDETRRWRIDPASLRLQTDDRTRAVLVISPHNPTGMVVQRALPSLTSLGLPVICDEVFAEFPYAVDHAPPLGALHPELPVFHLGGISKLFALPDLKLGWIALNEPARAYAERLDVLNDTFLGANALTQRMLPALFANGRPFVQHMADTFRANLDLAIGILGRCRALTVRAPDGGYYLFVEVHGSPLDEEALTIYLLGRGVLVHPGYFYGYERGTHLMISCLTERERLRDGLTRLVAAIDSLIDN